MYQGPELLKMVVCIQAGDPALNLYFLVKLKYCGMWESSGEEMRFLRCPPQPIIQNCFTDLPLVWLLVVELTGLFNSGVSMIHKENSALGIWGTLLPVNRDRCESEAVYSSFSAQIQRL